MSQNPLTGMYPSDRFLFDLFTDIWQNTPDEMNTNTINRGISINLYQDFPLGTSPFSFAAGLGFTSHNLYSDHQYTFSFEDGNYDFYPAEDENFNLRKNKLSLNYLTVPVEFRFRSRTAPRSFRLYAGMRAGYQINAHTKYHYSDTPQGVPEEIKIKEHKLENLQKFQFGLTGRIGYGRVNLNAYFPLTNIFDGNSVEDMRPISLGITLIMY